MRSASSARAAASDLLSPAISKTSATCRPTLIDGFSARPGSWYTMDTVRARSVRSASWLSEARSRPVTVIDPLLTLPFLGR